MRPTTTIRVSEETRDRLNDLARRRGSSAGDLVGELVRLADEESLLADAEASWQRLASDPETLAAYRSETTQLGEFDASLPDY